MQIGSHRRWTRVAGALAVLVIAAACAKKGPAEDTKSAGRAAPVDPEAPPIVVAMIDAHGGMAPWRSAKTVSFETEFAGTSDSTSAKMDVTVDRAKHRAYIDIPGTDQSMAWDGKRAWSLHWKQPYPPRVAALADYYFLCIPWLAMDPGVRLTPAGKDSLWDDPTTYSIVKMKFSSGDAPVDACRLYIDPQSKRLKAFSYVAPYRARPDSTSATQDVVILTPENVVIFEDYSKENGLVVPGRYTLYRKGDHLALGTAVIRDWSFDRPFDEKKLAMPDSAVVDESHP
jgi:hypothetical protein